MVKKIVKAIVFLILIVGVYFIYIFFLKAPDTRWADYKEWKKGSEEVITGASIGLKETHGGPEGYRYIFVNSIGESTYLSEGPKYNYPEGSILVKEQYKSKEKLDNGSYHNTIMIKLKEGESPETGDWGYASRLNGPVMKGKDAAFCSKCHSIPVRNTGDHVFTNANFFKE